MKAVIYSRVSSTTDRQNTKRQVADLTSYAKYKGYEVAKILGRNAFEVLETVKQLVDEGINLYMQKEQFTLLDDEGKPSIFAPIMIATLSTCAQLERENIKFRLNSGRQLYIEKGGKLGRKEGSTKSTEQKAEEYRQVIKELKRGTSIRKTAKLCDVSVSTVQRVKAEFNL